MSSPAIHHQLIQYRAAELRHTAQHSRPRLDGAPEKTIRRVAATLTRRNRRVQPVTVEQRVDRVRYEASRLSNGLQRATP